MSMNFETHNLGDLSFCLRLRTYIKLWVKCFLLPFLVYAILVLVPEFLVCTLVEPVSCNKLVERGCDGVEGVVSGKSEGKNDSSSAKQF